MEPPCEHGGVIEVRRVVDGALLTSMEPPCEHGGVSVFTMKLFATSPLQWSRRVNTAECDLRVEEPAPADDLPWSRRVNTAEWLARR